MGSEKSLLGIAPSRQHCTVLPCPFVTCVAGVIRSCSICVRNRHTQAQSLVSPLKAARPMDRSKYGILAGSTLVGFLVLANVAYAYLSANFDYDDILREPVATILQRFAAGGPGLVLAWAAFAWSALIFVAAACLVGIALAERDGKAIWIFTAAGAASGLIQSVGLFRWVFVVPSLADAYIAPDAGPAEQAAVIQTFRALNQYGGVALGEHLGQILLVAWTIGVVAACWRRGGALKWTSLIGIVTIPLWLIGQTELFATVIPQMPVLEVTPIAFMLWMVWLLALAVALAFPIGIKRADGMP
jgi:hypothetical protein